MADVAVNQTQWNAVSASDQTRIVNGLRQSGALKSNDRIVGDPNAPELTASTTLQPLWNPLDDLCKVACDVAAAAGLAWCTANTAGVGLAACIAAAEAARNLCKDQC